MNKSLLLLNTDRLILRCPIESNALKLQAYDERNANHLRPWKSTEPGLKFDLATI